MSFEPFNVLITGGAGFIGANFVRYWLGTTQRGKVVVFDALTYAGRRENVSGLELDPRYVFVRGDICDEVAVRNVMVEYDIDTLVHFAAESHVDRSISGPDEFIRTNVLGTHALLKVAKSLWLDVGKRDHRFHHVSTDEVYGSLKAGEPAFHEKTPFAPNSPYSASKAASDHLVRAYHETYALNTTLTNCSNNYGPYQFPEKLIPLIIINILMGKPLPVYGDGRQVRDWLHVLDHCRAIVMALKVGEPGGVYNIGGNSEMANIDLVNLLCAMVDEEITSRPELAQLFPDSPAAKRQSSTRLVTHVRDRPGHDRRYAIDYRKATRELGYSPVHDLSQGLRHTLAWYLDTPVWWHALLGSEYQAWIKKNYELTKWDKS